MLSQTVVRLRVAGRILWSVALLLPLTLVLAPGIALHIVPAGLIIELVVPLIVLWFYRCWTVELVVHKCSVLVRNPLRRKAIRFADIVSVKEARCGPYGPFLEGRGPCVQLRLVDGQEMSIVASYSSPEIGRLLSDLEQAVSSHSAESDSS